MFKHGEKNKNYMETIFRNKLHFLTIIVGIFCLWSCTQNSNNTDKKNSKTTQKLSLEYQSLQDSVNGSWQNMIKSDDQKISDIKRLLDEVSYTKKYNLFLHDSLLQMHKILSQKRYTQPSMSDSKLIDAYDNATDSIVKGVFRLVKTTPSIAQYPMAINLMEDIIAADNNVVLYRVKYDNWAKTYNIFVDRNKEKLTKINSTPLIEKYPLFTLGN